MHILNLNTGTTYSEFDINIYNKEDSYIILSTPEELKILQKPLDIDEISFNDCLKFDKNIKLDLFDNYDFLSLNTFELQDNKADIKEVNIYLSDKFILVVLESNHFLYSYIQRIIENKLEIEENPSVSLFKINYLIFKQVIINGFETLDKVEDLILDIEDAMLDKISDEHVIKINYIRNISRTIVKHTRPLLYIGDRILKENVRYLKYSDVKKYNLENLQGIDFGIDKLYNFAISTREMSDKLLDIYASQIAKKTNNIITKLTLLTGISTPLTIITGVYGMNFSYMPELSWFYGYPIVLLLMISIVTIAIIFIKRNKVL